MTSSGFEVQLVATADPSDSYWVIGEDRYLPVTADATELAATLLSMGSDRAELRFASQADEAGFERQFGTPTVE
jgi:hypothetical protein